MRSLFISHEILDKNSAFEDLNNTVDSSPWSSQTVNQVAESDNNDLSVLAPTLAQLSQLGRWIVLVGASKQTIN